MVQSASNLRDAGRDALPDAGEEEIERLLVRCAGGDRHALETLYRLTSARLLGVLLRILRRRELAEDALQDVFVRIWQRARQFDGYRQKLGAARPAELARVSRVMNHRNPDLLDRLASEYVLGTLRGPARRRFERLYQLDEATARIVHRWEDRLLALALGVRPIRPSARVWNEILRRVAEVDRSNDRRSIIRPWHLALAAGLVAVAVAIGWYQFGSHGFGWERRPESVAQFATADGRQLWRVEMSEHATTLSMATVGPIEAQPDHAYELWALPKGGAPVSLGLMPTAGSARTTLSDAQRVALLASRKLAISVEPPGGSPTGAPTGPVVHMADWLAQS